MNKLLFVVFTSLAAGFIGAAAGSGYALHRHTQSGNAYQASASVLRGGQAGAGSAQEQDRFEASIRAALSGRPAGEAVELRVEPVPDSNLLRFVARAPEPDLAASLANLAAASLLGQPGSAAGPGYQMVAVAEIPRGPFRESLAGPLVVYGFIGGLAAFTLTALVTGFAKGRPETS